MKKLLLLLAILSITAMACQKDFSVEPANVSVNDLVGRWKLARYQDLATKEDATQPDIKKFGEMTITFRSDETAGGRINCNSREFDFTIQNSQMTLTKGGTTKVGCDETWAENFYKVFENPTNTPHIRVNGTVLTLTSTDFKRKVTMDKQ